MRDLDWLLPRRVVALGGVDSVFCLNCSAQPDILLPSLPFTRGSVAMAAHACMDPLSPSGHFTTGTMFLSNSSLWIRLRADHRCEETNMFPRPLVRRLFRARRDVPCQTLSLRTGGPGGLDGGQHLARHGSSSLPSRRLITRALCFVPDIAFLIPLLLSCRIALPQRHKVWNASSR